MPYLNTPIYTAMHIYSIESKVTKQSDGEVWQYLTTFINFQVYKVYVTHCSIKFTVQQKLWMLTSMQNVLYVMVPAETKQVFVIMMLVQYLHLWNVPDN